MRVSTDQFVNAQTSKRPLGAKTAPGTSTDVGRFYFNSLDVPVRARVMHQDAAGMTLRQELPFLEINGKLRDENGREGSLENVSVCVRNGVPSLVLDVRYDDGRHDATVPFLIESTRAMRATKGLMRTLGSTRDVLPSPTLPSPGLKSKTGRAEPRRDEPRRDETLPYGVRTKDEDAATTPVMPIMEELLSAPLATVPPRGQRNGWWARMWRSFVALF